MKGEFKNLPSGWKVVRLGEICEINPSSRKLPEKFYYIDLEGVEKGILHSLKEVFLETAPSRAQRLLEKGDILFQMVRPYQKNNFLFELNGDFVASTGYAQIRTKQNRDFIFQYLNFDTFTKKVIEKCTGSNYPAINASVFSNLMILLPPLDEQEKIAEILSTWDEAINLTINLIENKKQFKKALMQNLLTAKIRFPEFQDEWEEDKLAKNVKIQCGYSFESKDFKKQGIPIIRISNISNTSIYMNMTDLVYFDEIQNEKKFLIKKNDLLIAMSGATAGKVSIYNLEQKAYLNQRVGLFRVTSPLLVNYGFLTQFVFSNFFSKQLILLLSTSAQPNISLKDIENLKIKLPNLNEQQKIAEVLTACDDEINLLNLKLENLKKAKQGLRQKLLKGEIRTCYTKKTMQ